MAKDKGSRKKAARRRAKPATASLALSDALWARARATPGRPRSSDRN